METFHVMITIEAVDMRVLIKSMNVRVIMNNWIVFLFVR